MKFRDSLSRGGKLIQKLGREAGNGVSKARDAVIRNETQIADAVQKATEHIGKGTQLVGQAVVANARKASQALHNSAAEASNTVRNKVEALGDGVTGNGQKAAASLAGGAAKGAVRIAGWTADGAVGVGKVIIAAGTLTERSAPAVAGGASGIARGSADAISGVLDAAVLSDSEIRALRERLVTSGSKLQYDSARFETKVEVAKRDGNRKELLD
ncbi:MAG: hypothetical protein KA260_05620, partial [Burkholderiales bacterium]|nr:hypothetical protein [Burkholderiales bacterium]